MGGLRSKGYERTVKQVAIAPTSNPNYYKMTTTTEEMEKDKATRWAEAVRTEKIRPYVHLSNDGERVLFLSVVVDIRGRARVCVSPVAVEIAKVRKVKGESYASAGKPVMNIPTPSDWEVSAVRRSEISGGIEISYNKFVTCHFVTL